ncbi:MAG TPA: bifunctional glutamate N-acetyltransferase/amino-acid acetyltransferase ArgJ, partial [Thermodesulfobacteriota bacterium]
MSVTVIEGGSVTSPQGFRAAGVAAGLKKNGEPDLALVESVGPATAAAVFTTNRFQSAHVWLDRQRLARTREGYRAVVVNAGNANAATGARGRRDAAAMARLAAHAIGVPERSVLVMSTGVIGFPLPMSKIARALPRAAALLSEGAGLNAARAMMTTDTFPKTRAVRVGGRAGFTVGGVCKGSGMIHPNMATMLAVLSTDAAVSPRALEAALREATEVSFNRVSVDGDRSPNDTAIALANGMASGVEIERPRGATYARFVDALTTLAVALAQDLARDGEGATKLIPITVAGARSTDEGVTVARAIANSPLVKCSFHGEEFNPGRILSAVGQSGAPVDIDRVAIWIAGLPVIRRGTLLRVPERAG